jgi:hypothetical protein
MKSFEVKVSKSWAIRRTLAYQVVGFQLNNQGLKSLDPKDCDSVELVKAIQLGYVKAINYVSSVGASWYHIDYKEETL